MHTPAAGAADAEWNDLFPIFLMGNAAGRARTRRYSAGRLEACWAIAAARGTEMRGSVRERSTAQRRCRSGHSSPLRPRATPPCWSAPSQFGQRPDIARTSVRSVTACVARSLDEPDRTDGKPHAQCPFAATRAAKARALHDGRSGGFSRQAAEVVSDSAGHLNTKFADFACGSGRNVKMASSWRRSRGDFRPNAIFRGPPQAALA